MQNIPLIEANVKIVKKLYEDKDFEKYKDTNFNEAYYKKIYKKKDIDCYWADTDNIKRILFKIRRKVISDDIQKLVRDVFEKFNKKNVFSKQTSFKADYNTNFRSPRSKISGFYDRPSPNIFNKFKTKTVCRTTAFTRDNLEKWKTVIPFFELIAEIYKELAPEEYNRQIKLFKKCPPGFQIGKTPFTTITSNYNWRTACHKDSGDFKDGLGNLTVVGDKGFSGGYLGFPQFGVAVDVRPGDTVIMDVHQWHCNTELQADDNNVRLSFVSYFREKMVKCNKKKIIDGEIYWFKD